MIVQQLSNFPFQPGVNIFQGVIFLVVVYARFCTPSVCHNIWRKLITQDIGWVIFIYTICRKTVNSRVIKHYKVHIQTIKVNLYQVKIKFKIFKNSFHFYIVIQQPNGKMLAAASKVWRYVRIASLLQRP